MKWRKFRKWLARRRAVALSRVWAPALREDAVRQPGHDGAAPAGSALTAGPLHTAGRPLEEYTPDQTRVLWIGQDTPVSRAELERLSNLGYTVCANWCRPDGNPETPQMSELDKTFDVVVVAGDMLLLADFLHDYHGRIIGRYYGDQQSPNLALWNKMALPLLSRSAKVQIISGIDFRFRNSEPGWVTDRARFVPHCTGPDLDPWLGSWVPSPKADVLVTKPAHASSAAHLRIARLADQYFARPGFSRLEIHPGPTSGFVIGDDGFSAVRLETLRSASGLLNLVGDADVIPMAVLEMIALGGPVLYFHGSMAAVGMPVGAPGELKTIEEAERKTELLRQHDPVFISEVLAAQEETRIRYAPLDARQTFDREMKATLDGHYDAPVPFNESLNREEEAQAVRLLRDMIDLAVQGEHGGAAARRAIETLYHVVLERDADRDGLNFHVGQLTGRGLDQVVADFMASDEAKQKRSQNRFFKWLADDRARETAGRRG